MTTISINGKLYAVVATDLAGGKSSCEQCAFGGTDSRFGLSCGGAYYADCADFDTLRTHYHFEEVSHV